jgi:hypothetical protein
MGKTGFLRFHASAFIRQLSRNPRQTMHLLANGFRFFDNHLASGHVVVS